MRRMGHTPRPARQVLGLVLLLAACDSGEPPDVAGVQDSAGVRIVSSISPRLDQSLAFQVRTEPEVVLGGREGPEIGLLYHVMDAALLPNGNLAVLSSGTQEILFYDGAGTLLRVAGGAGEGPGEFQRPLWLAVYADTLAVYDPIQGTGRLSLFTLDGEFLKSETPSQEGSPSGLPSTMLSDGSLLYLVSPGTAMGHVRFNTLAIRFPRPAGPWDTLAIVPGRERFRRSPRGGMLSVAVPFGREEQAAWAMDRLFLSNAEDFAIATFDLEGRYLMSIRLGVEKVEVTPELLDRWISTAMDDEILRQHPDLNTAFHDLFADAPVPAYMPTHGELLADPLGRLWVRRYVPPWDASNTWHVFDVDGVWLCDVELPPGLRLLDVGPRRLVGLRADALGVEYVQVHRVSGG